MRELVHEMRNELAVVRANLEALIDGKFAPTPERLSSIIQAVGQLEALVADLTSAEQEVAMPVRPAVINVCELLDREYHSIEGIAHERGVSVSIDRCPHPSAQCEQFYGDATRIGQIVKNILLNAVRYTPKGGSVSVDCKRRADQLEVRIADTGPGIAADEREKVFWPGFRSAGASDTNGSGFGLALVKQFVEAQGGTITVSETAPHGATFAVRLPGVLPSDARQCGDCRCFLDPETGERQITT
jgi:two-component system sensor histidine kinase BaeS